MIPIKAVIGLGNPGKVYYYNRHNIGFRIIDALAHHHNAKWQSKDNAEIAHIIIEDQPVLLMKPQTFMNSSGDSISFVQKQHIDPEQILVLHDELEKPFGSITIKQGGSHKGHNGVRSIIDKIGPNFLRLRFGIGRPTQKEDVPDYVLSNFSEPGQEIEKNIDTAVQEIEKLFKTSRNSFYS